jgi:activator of HSP90 ATPase
MPSWTFKPMVYCDSVFLPAVSTRNLKGRTMTEKKNPETLANTSTRREVIAGVAVAFGSLAGVSEIWGATQQQAMKETPSAAANEKRTSLHQEIEFKASAPRIYDALLDSKQFAAFTGLPAEIDPKAGGAFSMFGGLIVGRNVELIPNQRIVQAWRPTHWDPGIYSIVKFDLKPQGSGTVMVLDHTGFPEGDFDSLASGWKSHYFEPLRKFFT